MDFHTRVLLSELKPGDTVILKDHYFEFVRIEDKTENTYWLYTKLISNGEEYRYPWPKTAAIRIAPTPKATPVNDDKNTHTDRHDGGPEARAQRVIDREVANIDSPNKLRAAMGLGAVTESKDYVKLAREEVAKYINRKAEITDGFKVDVSYLYVVWFSKTLQNWKALISTSLPDGMYYEATFDGEKNKLYIDAYKKFDNEAVDL